MLDKALIKALKQKDNKTLRAFYLEHKPAFLGFAKKYPLDEIEVLDIYQDSIIALRENAISGKLDNLKSEVKTYLFSIGKYMIYNALKEQKKIHLAHDEIMFETLNDEAGFSFELVEELSEEQEQLRKAFKQLGKKCKDVLTLFYYRGFDLEEITSELNYTNKDVVKSQKSRCLKTLKDLIFKP